ncbi:unnamed protein product [Bursaphelenchus okinawaensis]|uniref:Protein kinase domain-containing protein n=1 Tax=Bursaphelenchus okinawaensis TaxID=465554 RepID=A0A811LHN5_9BILA|nr:unnamed protein product [Bursaphelenchus okinawaensis]CAG9123461.1 unnamed protein product [Bursaphelenchus okinawaensis]
MPRHHDDAGPIELPQGKVVGKRWKIVDKLGEGGCGAVYLVEDHKNGAKAAMKAESNFVAGGSVLKLEVQVLKRMVGRKYVAQLIAAGKKEKYSYMVMTLFGPSLSRLFKQCKKQFSVSTQVRLGVQILYGLKQIHEAGYIHRDIKPANLAVGRRGRESRILHVLDFGLSREYVARNSNGTVEMRRPRENCLFRGTTKYCSIRTHERYEQGRSDDLYSMMYVLCEMRKSLPWDRLRDKHEIGRMKTSTDVDTLLADSPKEYKKIFDHLNETKYEQRPDYAMIYKTFAQVITDKGFKFEEPYDWESLPENQLTPSEEKKNIPTLNEDASIDKTKTKDSTAKSEEKSSDKAKPITNGVMALFPPEEFEKNELGF